MATRAAPHNLLDVSNAEISRQTRLARARHRKARAAGTVAVSARYDRASKRVFIEMSTGVVFGLPAREIRALRNATPTQVADVEVDELGSGEGWTPSCKGLAAATRRPKQTPQADAVSRRRKQTP